MILEKQNIPLILQKQNEYLVFLTVVFSTINEKASDKDITSEDNKVFIKEKSKSEIIELKRDSTELKTKIFSWIDRTSEPFLKLTPDESDLLRHCASFAFYYITEKKEIDSTEESFINFYENYFKKLKATTE